MLGLPRHKEILKMNVEIDYELRCKLTKHLIVPVRQNQTKTLLTKITPKRNETSSRGVIRKEF